MQKKLLSLIAAFILTTSLTLPGYSLAGFGIFGEYKSVKAVDGAVQIPIKDVDDGKARHYSFSEGGKTIKFFVVKSRDGVIRAAFDACDVCFPAKKGYTQDGDFMICNNCGRRFHTSQVNVVEGGCNPAPLKRKEVGDNLVIQVSDILPGARFF